MSINGLSSNLPSSYGAMRPQPASTDAARAQQTAAEQANQARQGIDRATLAKANQAAALKPQTPIVGEATPQSVVPAEAPAGTDPALWGVLTTEERNFFAKTAALGPLTYSRIKEVTNPVPPAARGVRLDVRA